MSISDDLFQLKFTTEPMMYICFGLTQFTFKVFMKSSVMSRRASLTSDFIVPSSLKNFGLSLFFGLYTSNSISFLLTSFIINPVIILNFISCSGLLTYWFQEHI